MGLGTLKFSAPNAGCSAMSEEQNPIVRQDPEVGGISFEPVRDAEPFTDNEPAAFIWRALATWIFCTVVGGVALTALISTIEHYLGAPDSADLDYLGFVLGGFIGLLLAAIVSVNSLRHG